MEDTLIQYRVSNRSGITELRTRANTHEFPLLQFGPSMPNGYFMYHQV